MDRCYWCGSRDIFIVRTQYNTVSICKDCILRFLDNHHTYNIYTRDGKMILFSDLVEYWEQCPICRKRKPLIYYVESDQYSGLLCLECLRRLEKNITQYRVELVYP